MKQRIFCIFLVAVMMFTSVDITAFAQEASHVELGTIIEEANVQEEGITVPTEEIEEAAEPTEFPVEEPSSSENLNEEPTSEVTEEPVVKETEEPTEVPEDEETESLESPDVSANQEVNELEDITPEAEESEISEIIAEIEMIEEIVADTTAVIVYSGSCGDNLEWSIDESGLLVITGEGEMTEFADKSSVPWETYSSKITSINLPDGLKNISNYAFMYCDDLTEVVIPEGVTSIGNYAFAYSESLSTIAINNKDCEIGENAFLNISETVVMYGYIDSTTQTYANSEDIAFRDILGEHKLDGVEVIIRETSYYESGLIGETCSLCKKVIQTREVEKLIPEIALSSYNLSLYTGESRQLKYTYSPDNILTEDSLVWESSFPSVATVNENGLVNAVAPGTTTITLTSEFGVQCECDITVINYTKNYSFEYMYEDAEALTEYIRTHGDEFEIGKSIEHVVNGSWICTGMIAYLEDTGNLAFFYHAKHDDSLYMDVTFTYDPNELINTSQILFRYPEFGTQVMTLDFDSRTYYQNKRLSYSGTLGDFVSPTDANEYIGSAFTMWSIMLGAHSYHIENAGTTTMTLGNIGFLNYENAFCSHEKKDVVSVTKATIYEDGECFYLCKRCGYASGNITVDRIDDVYLSEHIFVHDGNEIKPSIEVLDSKGAVISKEYYDVIYKNNIEVGTASVIVSFKQLYSGEIKKDYTIEYKDTYVIFDANGGECDTVSKAVKYEKVYGELPVPEKKDYQFVGWYTEADGGKLVTKDSVVKMQENHTLFAHWIPVTYITFDAKGGKCDTVSKAVIYEQNYGELPEPTRKDYLFVGWYTAADGGNLITEENIVSRKDDHTLYAHWVPEDLWTEEVDDQTYTGKAIKPKVKVYNGLTLLKEKKDYTVSYKNNIKPNDAFDEKTAPTITVTGKGNYSGTETVTFGILKKDIEDIDISAADITVAYNKKVQKKVPAVKRGSTSLKKDTDFTVSYPDLEYDSKAYKVPGTYTILVKGKGGYTGTREVKLTITESKLMSKVTVSTIATQPYTGAAVTTATMTKAPTVKYGDKTKLKEGIHYTVSYENNVNIGTATMILTGTDTETPEGTFTGTKKVSFKIGGTSLTKAVVTGVPKSMTYTGLEIDEWTEKWGNPIKVVLNGDELTRAADAESEGDYIVSFSKNTNKGTATVTIKGINAYSGSVKKEFTINAYNINDNTGKNLVTEEMETDTIYVKGGTKPEPVIKFGETTLVKGKDYTLTYANNTKWNDGTGSKKPTVIITGKGNFKGSVKLNYTIEKQDLDNLSISATDMVYKKEKGAYKTVPVVKDLNNKALKNKTDFTVVSYTYGEDVTLKNGTEREEGDKVGSNDIVPADTLIRVTVTGKGNYTNYIPLVAEYRVVKSSISKATVTVPSQPYTGKSITIDDKIKIKVKVGKTKLDPEDFEIVDGSFKNNTKAGTASFTIKGVGNYGGTKTVTFKIKPKRLIWWWR